MKPLFLTANGLYHQEVHSAFNNMVGQDVSNLVACVITTADKDYKDKNYHAVNTQKILGDIGIRIVEFIDIEFEDPKKLESYDLIYINGGNPFYLLNQLKLTETDKLLLELRKSRYIIGHSAGAAVLGNSIEHAMILHPEWNDLNLIDLSGLGMIDSSILPHSNRYNEIDHRVIEMNPIYLEDNKYLLFG
jgi:dipeptidase E